MTAIAIIEQFWNASRAFGAGSRPLFQLVADFRFLLSMLLPIAVGLALLFFIWGLAVFILHSGDDKSKEEGRRKMLWGILALFVIVSIWGIISFLGFIFGIGQGGTGAVPGVDIRAGSAGSAGSALGENSGAGGGSQNQNVVGGDFLGYPMDGNTSSDNGYYLGGGGTFNGQPFQLPSIPLP